MYGWWSAWYVPLKSLSPCVVQTLKMRVSSVLRLLRSFNAYPYHMRPWPSSIFCYPHSLPSLPACPLFLYLFLAPLSLSVPYPPPLLLSPPSLDQMLLREEHNEDQCSNMFQCFFVYIFLTIRDNGVREVLTAPRFVFHVSLIFLRLIRCPSSFILSDFFLPRSSMFGKFDDVCCLLACSSEDFKFPHNIVDAFWGEVSSL